MNWQKLESKADFKELLEQSTSENIKGVAIFKHSTRCSISMMAKMRLTSSWSFTEELPIYYLDLINYREMSNLIASELDVYHESPQFILVKNKKCIYDASHMGISVNSIKSFLEENN